MVVLLHINDGDVRSSAAAGSPLLDVLREEAGLTAAKPGCRTGDCGACAVLLGWREPGADLPHYELHNACLTPVAMAAGCHVITAEGLAGPPGTELGAVQRAMLDAGAVQCGYCSPGLVVALTWALLTGVSPRRAALGTLCRCTGYGGIRRACDALAQPGPRSPGELLPPGVLAKSASLAPLPRVPWEQARGSWLAGGTDELPEHLHRAASHRRTTWLRRVEGLGAIAVGTHGIVLGAATTIAELQASPAVAERWPALVAHLELFGSPAVRQAATVGGNLAHAAPTADLAVALLAMGAVVELRGAAGGSRSMPLEDFFLGYHRTARGRDELVVAVQVPDPVPGSRLHLAKVAKRAHDDIATVSLAVRARVDGQGRVGEFRAAAGGVAPIPLLLPATAAALLGQHLDAATARAAMAPLALEVAPIDDLRGTADYKRALLGHLLLGALDTWCPGLAAAVLGAGMPSATAAGRRAVAGARAGAAP
ncbi:MAG TPA: FAD binding domain-containing protein [Candidatus Nanopelagicales bacterium]